MRLELRDLSCGYDELVVVRDLNLTIAEGEIVALLGPNGAGKTTTLLTVAGLLPASRGDIFIDDVDVAGKPAYRRAEGGLAAITDDRLLFPSLTVAECISLIRDRRRDPYEMFPALRALAGRRAGLLSGGEQQMLALALAFSPEPKLILIDEMSQGLAPVVVESLFPLLRSAVDSWGASILLVEQNVTAALTVADRAFVLSSGEVVVADMPAAELLQRRDVLESSYLGKQVLDVPAGKADV